MPRRLPHELRVKTLCGVSVKNNPYVPQGPEEVEETLLQVLRDQVG